MGRSPCCDATGLKRGPWTPEEDQKLLDFIQKHGHGSWRSLPEKAGLQRCGKSCRLRWINYLRPDIKRGNFSLREQKTIIQLHALLGNRWSAIASHLPKRTDNEIKNYWNTHIKKRLAMMGIDPSTHKPVVAALGSANGADPKKVSNLTHMAQWESARLEAEARLVRESSKQRQYDHQPGLPGPVPTLQLKKIASRLGAPRCLDILKAWQRVQLESMVIDNNGGDQGSNNLDSPTSTLNFLQNPRASSTNIASFQSNEALFTACQDMEFEGGEAWNMGTSNMGDEDSIKWFSNLLFNGCESDHFVQSNLDNDGNNGSNDAGVISEDDEHNNYWDDIFDLVDCGHNI